MSVDAVREAFDQLAPDYDERFTASLIGGLQREAFWRELEPLLPPQGRALDLGCGSGEDAVRLALRGFDVDAVDISPAMIDAARNRAHAEGLSDQIDCTALPLEQLEDLPPERYELVISNFGPLNCVADLQPLARTLADRVRPGGVAALCLMSQFCLWETLFYPLTLQIHKAVRRFSGEWAEAAVGGEETFRVYYPSVAHIQQAFAPQFHLERAPGIGVFLPPSYLEPFAQRFPKLTRALARVDAPIANKPLFRSIADHRLILLRRTSYGDSRSESPTKPVRA